MCIVNILSKDTLRFEVHHTIQPNQTKLALYKLLPLRTLRKVVHTVLLKCNVALARNFSLSKMTTR